MHCIPLLVTEHRFEGGEDWFTAIEARENGSVADRALENKRRALVDTIRLEF